MSTVEDQIVELKKAVAYDSKDYTIEILVGKYLKNIDSNENEVYVPEYQRDFVWDVPRQSRLIESIVLGLPIPPIFVAENSDGRLEIVDGSQRIRTLSAFLNDHLTLGGLEKVTRLNGLKFSDLDVSRKRKLNNTTITIIVLSENATDDVKNDLFERINKGSDILRNMETRKGIYRGEFTDFLYRDCAVNVNFRSSIELAPAVRNRQEYEELALRFFALADNYPRYTEFSRGVSEALDSYMASKRDSFDGNEEKKIKLNDFNKMVEFVATNFQYGFQKGPKRFVSRMFFEAIAVGVHLTMKEVPNLSIGKKIDVQQWLENVEFNKSVNGEYRTHSNTNLNNRIHFVRDRLLELSSQTRA